MSWEFRKVELKVSPPEFPKIESLGITREVIFVMTDEGFRTYELNHYQGKDGHWYNADGSPFKLKSELKSTFPFTSCKTCVFLLDGDCWSTAIYCDGERNYKRRRKI